MDKIIEKARKIYELAKRGEGGEAESARVKLKEFCERHKINLDELEEDQVKQYKYTYETKLEQDLMIQIASVVLKKERIEYRIFAKKKWVYFDFTFPQMIEFEGMLDHYKSQMKKEWKKIKDSFFTAFIHKHELFPDFDKEENSTNKKESKFDLCTIYNLIKSMDDKNYKKSIDVVK